MMTSGRPGRWSLKPPSDHHTGLCFVLGGLCCLASSAVSWQLSDGGAKVVVLAVGLLLVARGAWLLARGRPAPRR